MSCSRYCYSLRLKSPVIVSGLILRYLPMQLCGRALDVDSLNTEVCHMKRMFAGLLFCLAVTVPAAAQGSSARLEGQVVCCAECWAEADRTRVEFGTAEDLLKAKSCVENGDPTL